jgi:hypothetical protein
MVTHQRAQGQGGIDLERRGTLKKGIMRINRIGPSASELYNTNADGHGRAQAPGKFRLEYNPSFSGDGKWIAFTTERDGFGQSNIHSRGGLFDRLFQAIPGDGPSKCSPKVIAIGHIVKICRT